MAAILLSRALVVVYALLRLTDTALPEPVISLGVPPVFNVSEFLFPVYGSHYDPFATSVVRAVVAGAVVFLRGPETLVRFRYERRAN